MLSVLAHSWVWGRHARHWPGAVSRSSRVNHPNRHSGFRADETAINSVIITVTLDHHHVYHPFIHISTVARVVLQFPVSFVIRLLIVAFHHWQRLLPSFTALLFYLPPSKRPPMYCFLITFEWDDSGELILDDNRKAEALNNYFTSVLTVDDGVLPDFPRRVVENVLTDHVDFTVADVISTINHIKTSTTADPQGFTNAFLKRLKFSLAQPLSSVFSYIFSCWKIPNDWRNWLSLPSSRKVCLLM